MELALPMISFLSFLGHETFAVDPQLLAIHPRETALWNRQIALLIFPFLLSLRLQDAKEVDSKTL